MNEYQTRNLIRLGLRILGGSADPRLVERNIKERFAKRNNELMGVWRAALAIDCYAALDHIALCQDAANSLRFGGIE